MTLPWLLILTRRFSPALYVHQPRFELTYGPPKSTEVPIVPVKHTGGKNILDRTYLAVKGGRYGSVAEISKLSGPLKSSPDFLPLETHGNIARWKVCRR